MNCSDKYAELGMDYHWQWLERARHYVAWIVNCLAHVPYDGSGLRVLDFGCGDGVPAWFLSNRGFDVYGYDVLEGPLEVARAKVPGATFSTALPPVDQEFDFVIAIGVIEHMEKPHALDSAVMRAKRHSLVSIINPGEVDKFACQAYTPELLAKLFWPYTTQLAVEGFGDSLYKISETQE